MSNKFVSTSSELWTEVSSNYEEHSYLKKDGKYPANGFRNRILLEFFDSAPKGEVLDAGCGTGLMSRLLQKKGWKVTSVDYADGMVEETNKRAKSEGIDAVARKLSLQELSKLNKKFDYIMLNGVLPYVSREEESAVFEELKAISKENTVLVAAHYNLFFDIFGFDRYSVDAFEQLLRETNILTQKQLESTRSKIESRLAVPEKTLDEEKTMKLENPLEYANKLNKFGFDQFDLAYYNFFYLPPSSEKDQDQSTREQLELQLCRNSSAVLLARGFISFAKFVS